MGSSALPHVDSIHLNVGLFQFCFLLPFSPLNTNQHFPPRCHGSLKKLFLLFSLGLLLVLCKSTIKWTLDIVVVLPC